MVCLLDAVRHTFKNEYFQDQLTNRDQILSVALSGVGPDYFRIGADRFKTVLDLEIRMYIAYNEENVVPAQHLQF